jgi:hypothetical protein
MLSNIVQHIGISAVPMDAHENHAPLRAAVPYQTDARLPRRLHGT